MLRLLKGAYFWTAGISATAVFVGLCALRHGLVILTGGPRDGRAVHRVAAAWGRTVFRLTPGWSIKVEGRENLPPDGQPAVIVSNHESMTDIFVLYFLNIQFRWLSKESVFKVPMVGRAMTWANYVPVRRGDRSSQVEALRASAARLRQGVSMVFFPEGTRSATGVIQPFKLGAFRLAQGEKVPVVPIVIKGARELLPKHGRVPQRASVSITVLPAVPPPVAGEDLDVYAEKIREKIVAVHSEKVSVTPA